MKKLIFLLVTVFTLSVFAAKGGNKNTPERGRGGSRELRNANTMNPDGTSRGAQPDLESMSHGDQGSGVGAVFLEPDTKAIDCVDAVSSAQSAVLF